MDRELEGGKKDSRWKCISFDSHPLPFPWCSFTITFPRRGISSSLQDQWKGCEKDEEKWRLEMMNQEKRREMIISMLFSIAPFFARSQFSFSLSYIPFPYISTIHVIVEHIVQNMSVLCSRLSATKKKEGENGNDEKAEKRYSSGWDQHEDGDKEKNILLLERRRESEVDKIVMNREKLWTLRAVDDDTWSRNLMTYFFTVHCFTLTFKSLSSSSFYYREKEDLQILFTT